MSLFEKEEIVNNTGDEPLKCLRCGKAFRLLEQLKCHLKIVCGNESPMQKAMFQATQWESGQNSPSEIEPYNCNICGNEFLLFKHFKKHILDYLDEEVQTCENCGRRFHKSKLLILHKKLFCEINKKLMALEDSDNPNHAIDSLKKKLHLSKNVGRGSIKLGTSNLQKKPSHFYKKVKKKTKSKKRQDVIDLVEDSQKCDRCGRTFPKLRHLKLHKKLFCDFEKALEENEKPNHSMDNLEKESQLSKKHGSVSIELGTSNLQNKPSYFNKKVKKKTKSKKRLDMIDLVEDSQKCDRCGRTFPKLRHLKLHKKRFCDFEKELEENENLNHSMDDLEKESQLSKKRGSESIKLGTSNLKKKPSYFYEKVEDNKKPRKRLHDDAIDIVEEPQTCNRCGRTFPKLRHLKLHKKLFCNFEEEEKDNVVTTTKDNLTFGKSEDGEDKYDELECLTVDDIRPCSVRLTRFPDLDRLVISFKTCSFPNEINNDINEEQSDSYRYNEEVVLDDSPHDSTTASSNIHDEIVLDDSPYDSSTAFSNIQEIVLDDSSHDSTTAFSNIHEEIVLDDSPYDSTIASCNNHEEIVPNYSTIASSNNKKKLLNDSPNDSANASHEEIALNYSTIASFKNHEEIVLKDSPYDFTITSSNNHEEIVLDDSPNENKVGMATVNSPKFGFGGQQNLSNVTGNFLLDGLFLISAGKDLNMKANQFPEAPKRRGRKRNSTTLPNGHNLRPCSIHVDRFPILDYLVKKYNHVSFQRLTKFDGCTLSRSEKKRSYPTKVSPKNNEKMLSPKKLQFVSTQSLSKNGAVRKKSFKSEREELYDSTSTHTVHSSNVFSSEQMNLYEFPATLCELEGVVPSPHENDCKEIDYNNAMFGVAMSASNWKEHDYITSRNEDEEEDNDNDIGMTWTDEAISLCTNGVTIKPEEVHPWIEHNYSSY